MGQVSLERASKQAGDGEPSRDEEGNGAVCAAVARGVDGQGRLLGDEKSRRDGRKRKYGRVQEQEKEEEKQGLASLKRNDENVLAIARYSWTMKKQWVRGDRGPCSGWHKVSPVYEKSCPKSVAR